MSSNGIRDNDDYNSVSIASTIPS